MFKRISLIWGKKKSKMICITGLVFLLISNYLLNFILPDKELYNRLYDNSETLVNGKIFASDNGVKTKQYGLGYWCDILTYYIGYDMCTGKYNKDDVYYSDEDYIRNYAIDGKSIIVNENPYTERWAIIDNYVVFEDGSEIRINDVYYDNAYRRLFFDDMMVVSEKNNGSIDKARFKHGEYISPCGGRLEYRSQIGLQGFFFDLILNDGFSEKTFFIMHVISAFLFALTASLISIRIFCVISRNLGVIYYFVFLLSPWLVGFAHNAYWLIALWFLPMLVGIIFVEKQKHAFGRMMCYVAAFATIAVKTACGYEYISAILIGMVVFPLFEIIRMIVDEKKENRNIVKCFKNLVVFSLSGFLGFVVSLICHSYLRGSGNVLEGIRNIYVEDIARSTISNWTLTYGDAYKDSMSATIKDVISIYFRGDYGDFLCRVPGGAFKYFMLISIIALIIICVCMKEKSIKVIVLYIITLSMALSWFILAKSHSFMHGSLNFVLWYMGFVQSMIYTIGLMIGCLYTRIRTRIAKRV